MAAWLTAAETLEVLLFSTTTLNFCCWEARRQGFSGDTKRNVGMAPRGMSGAVVTPCIQRTEAWLRINPVCQGKRRSEMLNRPFVAVFRSPQIALWRSGSWSGPSVGLSIRASAIATLLCLVRTFRRHKSSSSPNPALPSPLGIFVLSVRCTAAQG